MRILFMGTPDFAVRSLEKLAEEKEFDLAAVFTRGDKPKNRGMKTVYSPVKETAIKKGIAVYQPESLKDKDAENILRGFSPDIITVVAYGKILPEELLKAAPLGAVNLHPSLLPKYRGAAPVQRAIMNGETMTGVTTMYLSKELDSGDIIYTEETPIGEFETAVELNDRLKELGAVLLCKTLRDIASGTAPRMPQNNAAATYAKPVERYESAVDWNRPPREIINKIRGLLPWPTATAIIGGVVFKLFSAEPARNIANKTPGSIISAGKNGFEISCMGGETLFITQIQAPGGRRMAACDYIRGHKTDLEGL
ncbi:MAG: methionyl-tRNA formyltransferase [Oscillospiraceae bacterium]|nr:methionyl-tRNA formyltransferase [Oscillospiraceae bacterium]